MCRKLMSLMCLVLVLGLVGSVSAQHNWTNADPANDLWTTPGNWDLASVPGPADLALINSPPVQGPIINTDVSVAEIGGLRLNSNVDQVMEISSGNVQIGWWWGLAEAGNGTATLNMVGDANIAVGGIEGGYDGTTVINIGGTTQIESVEWRLCNEDTATVYLNITDQADVHLIGEMRVADKGTMVTTISGNPNIVLDDKWRNGDETGHSEIDMSGGSLYTGRYLSCYDDGSAKITFSGGTANVDGLSFSGRAGRDYELNVTGTADVTARTEVRLGYGMAVAGGSATLNVSGGVLSCGFFQTYGDHGSMNINLTGGLLSSGGLDLNGPYSMDICGGTLIVNGDVTETVYAGIKAGYITACGGATEVHYDYDDRNAGKTTVTMAVVREIDIKPGSCPNPLNLESKGILPVAVLGSPDFHVTDIDLSSVRLEGVAPFRSRLEDVATPIADGNECDCTAAGADGYTDLVLKFKTQDVVTKLISDPNSAEPAPDDVLVLTLTATLTDGSGIAGRDCVVVAGSVPRTTRARKADINEDALVNFRDFAWVAEYWLEPAY